MRNALIIIILLCFISSCKEDEVLVFGDADKSSGQILLINEGNFQQGNASLGSYNPTSGEYSDQLFKQVNGYPIGDVFNSITKVGKEYWCVINNSGKIYVLDSASRKVLHTISGFKSPRYAQYAEGYNKMYVTDLYANKVSIVSTISHSIVGEIPLKGWTELMLMVDDKLLISSNDRPWIFVVNPNNDQIEDSIQVGNLTNSMLRTRNEKVLVLCEGKLGSNELAELFVIGVESLEVRDKITFEAGVKPRFLRLNPVNGNLFYINKELQEIDALTFRFKDEIKIDPENVYAFNISPAGDFYIGDAGSYVERSKINVYGGKNFEQKALFLGGVNTNAFVFE